MSADILIRIFAHSSSQRLANVFIRFEQRAEIRGGARLTYRAWFRALGSNRTQAPTNECITTISQMRQTTMIGTANATETKTKNESRVVCDAFARNSDRGWRCGGRSLHGGIVANQLDRVPLRVVDVQRTPMDPSVFRRGYGRPELFEPFFLGLKVGRRDLECKMIDRAHRRTGTYRAGIT